MVKPIFSAAMSATPYRKDFYGKLGSDEFIAFWHSHPFVQDFTMRIV
jgi:hypothetical protein